MGKIFVSRKMVSQRYYFVLHENYDLRFVIKLRSCKT